MKIERLPDIKHKTFINASPDVVYERLSTGKGWDSWFTQGTSIEPRPGGSIRLRWESFGVERFTCEDGGGVLEAKPGKLLVFQWCPGTRPTTVSLSLRPLGKGTLLTLIESGYSDTEPDLAALIGCAVGWGEALTLLKVAIEHGIVYGDVPPDLPEE